MKHSNKNQPVKCSAVEELLIKRTIERLSAEENILLQNHLKACGHCQDFQSQLGAIRGRMTISQDSPLTPDPAIRRSLMKRMNAFKPKKHRVIDSFWQRILNILEYRIPVYQGLIGLACGVLIFMMTQYFSFSSPSLPGNYDYQMRMADTTFYHLNIIKNLQIIEQQKIGKNVREDSLLTRFIVSAM